MSSSQLGPKALAVGLIAFFVYRVVWEVADGERYVDRIAGDLRGRV